MTPFGGVLAGLIAGATARRTRDRPQQAWVPIQIIRRGAMGTFVSAANAVCSRDVVMQTRAGRAGQDEISNGLRIVLRK